MNKKLLDLRKTGKTIFSSGDLAMIFGKEYSDIRGMIAYYCEQWYLRRIRQGIYAIGNDSYDPFELANKILHPSYISLDTILRKEGVIFQYDETITVVSYKTALLEIDGLTIRFRAIKKSVLLNDEWIIHTGAYSIASKERAFLDMLYLSRDGHFDNLRSIDWKQCFELVKIYHSQALEKRLSAQYNQYA